MVYRLVGTDVYGNQYFENDTEDEIHCEYIRPLSYYQKEDFFFVSDYFCFLLFVSTNSMGRV